MGIEYPSELRVALDQYIQRYGSDLRPFDYTFRVAFLTDLLLDPHNYKLKDKLVHRIVDKFRKACRRKMRINELIAAYFSKKYLQQASFDVHSVDLILFVNKLSFLAIAQRDKENPLLDQPQSIADSHFHEIYFEIMTFSLQTSTAMKEIDLDDIETWLKEMDNSGAKITFPCDVEAVLAEMWEEFLYMRDGQPSPFSNSASTDIGQIGAKFAALAKCISLHAYRPGKGVIRESTAAGLLEHGKRRFTVREVLGMAAFLYRREVEFTIEDGGFCVTDFATLRAFAFQQLYAFFLKLHEAECSCECNQDFIIGDHYLKDLPPQSRKCMFCTFESFDADVISPDEPEVTSGFAELMVRAMTDQASFDPESNREPTGQSTLMMNVAVDAFTLFNPDPSSTYVIDPQDFIDGIKFASFCLLSELAFGFKPEEDIIRFTTRRVFNASLKAARNEWKQHGQCDSGPFPRYFAEQFKTITKLKIKGTKGSDILSIFGVLASMAYALFSTRKAIIRMVETTGSLLPLVTYINYPAGRNQRALVASVIWDIIGFAKERPYSALLDKYLGTGQFRDLTQRQSDIANDRVKLEFAPTWSYQHYGTLVSVLSPTSTSDCLQRVKNADLMQFIAVCRFYIATALFFDNAPTDLTAEEREVLDRADPGTKLGWNEDYSNRILGYKGPYDTVKLLKAFGEEKVAVLLRQLKWVVGNGPVNVNPTKLPNFTFELDNDVQIQQRPVAVELEPPDQKPEKKRAKSKQRHKKDERPSRYTPYVPPEEPTAGREPHVIDLASAVDELKAERMKTALEHFRKCLECEKFSDVGPFVVGTLQLCVAFCIINDKNSGDSELQTANSALMAAEKAFECEIFPVGSFLRGKLYLRNFQFPEALEILSSCKKIVDAGVRVKVIEYPFLHDEVHFTKRECLAADLPNLLNEATWPPSPDFVCRLSDCPSPNLFKGFHFRGADVLSCTWGCSSAYHPDCFKVWLAVEQIRDPKTIQSEEHRCPTPDCGGILCGVIVYDKNGEKKATIERPRPPKGPSVTAKKVRVTQENWGTRRSKKKSAENTTAIDTEVTAPMEPTQFDADDDLLAELLLNELTELNLLAPLKRYDEELAVPAGKKKKGHKTKEGKQRKNAPVAVPVNLIGFKGRTDVTNEEFPVVRPKPVKLNPAAQRFLDLAYSWVCESGSVSYDDSRLLLATQMDLDVSEAVDKLGGITALLATDPARFLCGADGVFDARAQAGPSGSAATSSRSRQPAPPSPSRQPNGKPEVRPLGSSPPPRPPSLNGYGDFWGHASSYVFDTITAAEPDMTKPFATTVPERSGKFGSMPAESAPELENSAHGDGPNSSDVAMPDNEAGTSSTTSALSDAAPLPLHLRTYRARLRLPPAVVGTPQANTSVLDPSANAHLQAQRNALERSEGQNLSSVSSGAASFGAGAVGAAPAGSATARERGTAKLEEIVSFVLPKFGDAYGRREILAFLVQLKTEKGLNLGGLSSSQIGTSLVKFIWAKQPMTLCPACLRVKDSTDDCIQMKCGHTVHSPCVVSLSVASLCPMCCLK